MFAFDYARDQQRCQRRYAHRTRWYLRGGIVKEFAELRRRRSTETHKRHRRIDCRCRLEHSAEQNAYKYGRISVAREPWIRWIRGRRSISSREGRLSAGREWGQHRGHQFYDNEPHEYRWEIGATPDKHGRRLLSHIGFL